MTRVVGISALPVACTTQRCVDEEALVITLAYDDGRVVQQFGEDSAWVQIKDPDEFRQMGEMVGVCKDCHRAIWEVQEWEFSVKNKWMRHSIVEDCAGEGE